MPSRALIKAFHSRWSGSWMGVCPNILAATLAVILRPDRRIQNALPGVIRALINRWNGFWMVRSRRTMTNRKQSTKNKRRLP